jgi:hypothetical protein
MASGIETEVGIAIAIESDTETGTLAILAPRPSDHSAPAHVAILHRY